MGTTATGRRHNRSWPEALKREIVAASFAPGSSVSVVSRQYDVDANQVFSWRRRYRDDPRPAADRSAPQRVPVMITAEPDAVAASQAELAVARAKASDDQALIAHKQLRIAKPTRELYGPRSERTSRLLDQIELQFEELESSATEDEIAAEVVVAKTTTEVAAFTRKRPKPQAVPRASAARAGDRAGTDRLPLLRRRAAAQVGRDRYRDAGIDPAPMEAVQHVREKFTCRVTAVVIPPSFEVGDGRLFA
jgi:transposase-like protein